MEYAFLQLDQVYIFVKNGSFEVYKVKFVSQA